MGVPLKILLIEDDSDDYLVFQEYLNDISGYDISLVWDTNNKDGFERLENNQFDVCFVDYRIGVETGTDFIAKANASQIDAPMILITGVHDYSVDVEASEVGAVDFIEKDALSGVVLERAIRYSLAGLQKRKLRRVHENMVNSNLVHELRDAIMLKQFEVYLQPEVNCETRRIDKAEALVRWNHPKRGLLSPAQFIDVAERSELIVGIGKCVIEQVCEYSNRLNALKNDIKIAFNVSIAQMERHDFADQVTQILAAYRTDPSTIEIEITESAAMREPDLVRSHINALKHYGIKFAVDDFGTGYSGLATLRDFPFDIIKIDRSFVQTAEKSARDRAMAKTIFYLADVMRIETVAEGIETETQFAFVKNYGVTYAQGYLFSKPLSFNEFRVYANRFNFQKDKHKLSLAG